MALDDAAIDREMSASVINAFREDFGARGNRDAIEGSAYSTGKYFSAVLDAETRNVLIEDGVSFARVESEVAFSGGNSWTKKVSGGAKEGGGLAPGTSRDFDILLDEGERVVYQLENVSGAEIKATIDREQINELVE